MKKKLATLTIVAAIAATALPAATSAHTAPPCNDSNGDGAPSGQEYAAHHISALAREGLLGQGGHIPGTHQGFSLCDPSALAPGQD